MDNAAGAKTNWLMAIAIGRNPKVTLVRAVVLVAVSIVVFKFFLLPIRVQGVSMMPTYSQNGVNFVNRLAYVVGEPKRGDVVAIRYAGVHLMLMKRIVGLPGETIQFRDGKLVVNGQKMEEPYLKYPCSWSTAPETVGPNQFYVVGDNRSMGETEHEKGRADRERIMGKVLL